MLRALVEAEWGDDPAGGEGGERRERGERSEPCSRRGADAKELFSAALLLFHSVVACCALRGRACKLLTHASKRYCLQTRFPFHAKTGSENASFSNTCLKYAPFRGAFFDTFWTLLGGDFAILLGYVFLICI